MVSIKKIISIASLTLLLAAGHMAYAQTGTTTPSPTPGAVTPTTPGVPNTGAGGNAGLNLLLLSSSALLAAAGAGYLYRNQRGKLSK